LSELGHQETPAVFVLGWPDFYQKFGFKPAFEWGLRWEHPADREVFMGLEMEKDFLSGPLGVVRYLPQFSAPWPVAAPPWRRRLSPRPRNVRASSTRCCDTVTRPSPSTPPNRPSAAGFRTGTARGPGPPR